jgi:hypothetical protein
MGYFQRGYDIEKLRPLLRSESERVLRSAVWIASELADTTGAFVQEAVDALQSHDRFVRYYSLDVLMLGTSRARCHQFHNIAAALEDADAAVQEKAMFLLSRANAAQIQEASDYYRVQESSTHEFGLQMMSRGNDLGLPDLQSMLGAQDSLLRKYGAIVAERLYPRYKEALEGLTSVEDESVKAFASNMMELHAIVRRGPRD